MTRIAVVGARGMLGRDLVAELDDYEIDPFGRNELDITNSSDLAEALQSYSIVINAAAFTAVDDAESRREEAFAINADGPRNLARTCRVIGATLFQISTDYVFDGTASTPYGEDAVPNPQSVYGQSKLAGERAVLAENPDSTIILRTSWLYGAHGTSFPRSILQAGLSRQHLDVVNDQWGQPTWTVDVARMISRLIGADISNGVFHTTNSGKTTWHALASRLFELAGWDSSRVRETTSETFSRPAPRPAWSVLGHDEWLKRGLPAPRKWEDALAEAWECGMSRFALPEQP